MMQIAFVIITSLHTENTALFLLKCIMNPIFLKVIILIICFGFDLEFILQLKTSEVCLRLDLCEPDPVKFLLLQPVIGKL
jgi:hypothetical protein